MPQNDFESHRREFPDEAAQRVVVKGHIRKSAHSRNEAIRHVGDRTRDRHRLPGIIRVELRQRLALRDHMLRHPAEECAHHVEGDDDTHRFCQPGNDRPPEETEDKPIRGRNEDGRKKSDHIDHDIDEETHEGRIHTEGLEVGNGTFEIPVHGELVDRRIERRIYEVHAHQYKQQHPKERDAETPLRSFIPISLTTCVLFIK